MTIFCNWTFGLWFFLGNVKSLNAAVLFWSASGQKTLENLSPTSDTLNPSLISILNTIFFLPKSTKISARSSLLLVKSCSKQSQWKLHFFLLKWSLYNLHFQFLLPVHENFGALSYFRCNASPNLYSHRLCWLSVMLSPFHIAHSIVDFHLKNLSFTDIFRRNKPFRES